MFIKHKISKKNKGLKQIFSVILSKREKKSIKSK